MTSLVVPILVLLVSFVLTYVFCLRPMRRGQCAVSRRHDDQQIAPANQDAEIARLREEIQAMRAR